MQNQTNLTTNKGAVEVQIAWIEGLIRVSEKLNKHKRVIESNDLEQMKFLADLAQLQGYISSAKYLIRTTNDEMLSEDI